MEYQDAFADLAEVHLEDSWVLDIAPTEQGVTFRLEAVLTPGHPRYKPPAPGEEYCYRRALLSVATTKRSMLNRSDAPPATDASGELDFGNIELFTLWTGTARSHGNDLLTVKPSVAIAFE